MTWSGSTTSAASRPTGPSRADEETAVNGHWVKAPGHELFQRLKEVFGDLPFIAEDLGLITPEVDDLREHFGMPGMRILQFGFADRGGHSTSRTSMCPTPSPTPARTTTTPPSAGGSTEPPRVERANVQTYLGPIHADEESSGR